MKSAVNIVLSFCKSRTCRWKNTTRNIPKCAFLETTGCPWKFGTYRNFTIVSRGLEYIQIPNYYALWNQTYHILKLKKVRWNWFSIPKLIGHPVEHYFVKRPPVIISHRTRIASHFRHLPLVFPSVPVSRNAYWGSNDSRTSPPRSNKKLSHLLLQCFCLVVFLLFWVGH